MVNNCNISTASEPSHSYLETPGAPVTVTILHLLSPSRFIYSTTWPYTVYVADEAIYPAKHLPGSRGAPASSLQIQIKVAVARRADGMATMPLLLLQVRGAAP